MYIEYYLKFLHSIILYCLLLLCHFASSKLRITSSTFFKNCSMYIDEYYLSIFSSVSLYYSLILCKIIVTVLFYCAMSNPKTLATSSSSLPSFHLYIFQCAIFVILNFLLLRQTSSKFFRYTFSIISQISPRFPCTSRL